MTKDDDLQHFADHELISTECQRNDPQQSYTTYKERNEVRNSVF